MDIPIEASARHIHLSLKDLEKLFGLGYKLKVLKNLSQPDQFAAQEEIILIGLKNKLKTRIVGPLREKTQIEISLNDAFFLGITPSLRLSGDLCGSLGIKIKGPKAEINLKEGLIIAKRHLHLSSQEAKELNLRNNDLVSVKIQGERGLIFNNIVVRSGEKHKMALHLDTDEANAAGINQKTKGELIK